MMTVDNDGDGEAYEDDDELHTNNIFPAESYSQKIEKNML